MFFDLNVVKNCDETQPTFSCRLHSRGGVHRIAEEAIPRHLQPDDARDHRSYPRENQIISYQLMRSNKSSVMMIYFTNSVMEVRGNIF